MGGAIETPLRTVLRNEGRKQRWLAQRAGIHESRVSLIVNGLYPSDDEAAAIAEALGRTREELWPVPPVAA